VRHMSRFNGLLHLKVSRARVSQFASKLAKEQRRVVHVASLWRSHEDEAEDGWVDVTGYIGLFYPYFAIFVVLGSRGISVFWMSL
jgi:hypothetical protein